MDFLRVRDFPVWEKDSKEALYVRGMGKGERVTFETYRKIFETRPPETIANVLVCLIHQTNYLLDRQIRRMEEDFLKEGGLRERMTRARLQRRGRLGERQQVVWGPMRPISPWVALQGAVEHRFVTIPFIDRIL